MKKNTKKKGFTIVELVIVIAVIAILAAVLIPTFGNMIQKANDSKALQEARNDFTSYMIEHATEGNDDFVIQGGKYYYAVKDGVLDTENKYETAEAAQNAVNASAEWELVDSELGIYTIVKNDAGNEGAGEGSDDDDSSTPPVQPQPTVTLYFADQEIMNGKYYSSTGGNRNVPPELLSNANAKCFSYKVTDLASIAFTSGGGAGTAFVFVLVADDGSYIIGPAYNDCLNGGTYTVAELTNSEASSFTGTVYFNSFGNDYPDGFTLTFAAGN